ncbi:membrane-bound PQQ-dependent dehydrogenase, glucose/quinate/shikimate family [Variovorax dokdonensis]|uniref:Membrane-bound PQQ-dependent dehydrogenase, glucose/quinate/shikimate family n=1 Tax=Variovorax dokdonensis TaxID=344883 RepID=A0ABT7NBR3_9BURK|nr:membrane-bound PQQ-dependent dehydrogenase, glucose/quinate/shikimate family [Variovorax dokdonensis]MDM0045369.1 membrane-bound PQQ-dependent dehydrogenase, glucose/quinate/shikimate family [Variovorax dokdonensis]
MTLAHHNPQPAGSGWLRAPLGVLFLVGGLALAGFGAWLLVLGGSAYYTVAGVLMLVDGILLLQRRPSALWLFAILLGGTLAWAIWEAGMDWWPLAARLDVLFVLALLLLTPWVRRGLVVSTATGADASTATPTWRAATRSGTLALGIAAIACVGVAGLSVARDQHRVAGQFDFESSAASPLPESAAGDAVPAGEWHAYGRTAFGQRYSPLAQITPANVGQLQKAWEFHTGDVRGRPGDPEETTYEVTPLKVGNRLYLCTPHQSVIALDATTGAQVWRRELGLPQGLALQHLTCRGLSYAPAAAAANAAPTSSTGGVDASKACGARLFMATPDGRLLAMSAQDGHACPGFGKDGAIDLKANMPNSNPGSYYSTSPVVVTQHALIVGGTVLDNVSTKEESGVVRAFDIDSGKLLWNWDSGNPDVTTPIEPGKTYTANSPNSWSAASVDESLGLVYLPMGNQPPDQWGANRSAAVERYSSSVVALDLATGQVRWVFQGAHHDLWDYDVPAQPSLVDIRRNGQTIPALVQPTKQGELFVLDRRTGEPVLPVTETPAPGGAAPGDHTAPTQPVSALSFAPEPLSGKRMWGATLADQLACRIAFHKLKYDGRFTPPSEQGTIVYPGNFGVFNWGAVAVDPVHQVVFATPAYLAFVSRLVPRPNDHALVVNDEPPKGSLPAINENFGAPYGAKMKPFLSPLGIPCQQPPWGYVAGADLRTGKIVWQHRNGTVRDLSPVPLPFHMGVPGIGGPIVTAGGVAFYSGNLDNYARAYAMANGRQLWESRLPAGGQATPMTYSGEDGRQYLLVVAGGHGSTGTKPGDSVIAYALPKTGG